jgi:hypothetical protein
MVTIAAYDYYVDRDRAADRGGTGGGVARNGSPPGAIRGGFLFSNPTRTARPLTLINSPLHFVDYPSDVKIKAEDAIRMKPPKIVPR